jgi:hypothetical protein
LLFCRIHHPINIRWIAICIVENSVFDVVRVGFMSGEGGKAHHFLAVLSHHGSCQHPPQFGRFSYIYDFLSCCSWGLLQVRRGDWGHLLLLLTAIYVLVTFDFDFVFTFGCIVVVSFFHIRIRVVVFVVLQLSFTRGGFFIVPLRAAGRISRTPVLIRNSATRHPRCFEFIQQICLGGIRSSSFYLLYYHAFEATAGAPETTLVIPCPSLSQANPVISVLYA